MLPYLKVFSLILEKNSQSHFSEQMSGNKGEHWEEDYYSKVGWNDNGDHKVVGVLGGCKKQSGVWR
jgi:hypothetical protein